MRNIENICWVQQYTVDQAFTCTRSFPTLFDRCFSEKTIEMLLSHCATPSHCYLGQALQRVFVQSAAAQRPGEGSAAVRTTKTRASNQPKRRAWAVKRVGGTGFMRLSSPSHEDLPGLDCTRTPGALVCYKHQVELPRAWQLFRSKFEEDSSIVMIPEYTSGGCRFTRPARVGGLTEKNVFQPSNFDDADSGECLHFAFTHHHSDGWHLWAWVQPLHVPTVPLPWPRLT